MSAAIRLPTRRPAHCPSRPRGGEREASRAGQRERNEDHVAGHAGDEHPTEPKDADRVDETREERQADQQGGQRTVHRSRRCGCRTLGGGHLQLLDFSRHPAPGRIEPSNRGIRSQ
jgi:hypothetical protein